MRFIPAFLTRNWTLKLAAFTLAVLLWTLVRVEAPDRQAIPGVPVRVNVADPEWIISSAPVPAQVQVGFVGPTRGLLRLASDPPVVEMTVERVTGQDTLLTIPSDAVRYPQDVGLTVESIEPASVQISIERKMSRLFPFHVALVGTLDPSLAFVTHPVAAPTRGRVQGSASAVEQLQRIPLEEIDLAIVRQSGRIATTVDPEAMAGFTVTPSEVEVEFTLEVAIDRTFEAVPVAVEGGAGLVADPPTVGVTLHGAASLVESIDPLDLRVVVRDPPLPVADTGVVLPVVVQGAPPLVTARASRGTVRVRDGSRIPGGASR